MTTPKKQLHDAAYIYDRGWKEARQPEGNMSPADYYLLASEAARLSAEKIRETCYGYGFSVVEIPHEEFLKYERSLQRFRPWFKEYCINHNLNPQADICLISPHPKSISSSRNKSEERAEAKEPQEIIDYLRCMPIVLQKRQVRNDGQMLSNMVRLCDLLYKDSETIAHKDYLWIPHSKTQMRAHKFLQPCTIPEYYDINGIRTPNQFPGHSILAEIKVECESVMDLDKFTRQFLNMKRAADRAQAAFYSQSSPSTAIWEGQRTTPRSSQKHAERSQNITQLSQKWGRLLYNRVAEDTGLNMALCPKETLERQNQQRKAAGKTEYSTEPYAPAPFSEIWETINDDLKENFPHLYSVGFMKKMEASGIFPQKVQKRIHQRREYLEKHL